MIWTRSVLAVELASYSREALMTNSPLCSSYSICNTFGLQHTWQSSM